MVCVSNAGYQASLERNKIYVALPDHEAEAVGDIRVIDESGEDYLFDVTRFVAVELPSGPSVGASGILNSAAEQADKA